MQSPQRTHPPGAPAPGRFTASRDRPKRHTFACQRFFMGGHSSKHRLGLCTQGHRLGRREGRKGIFQSIALHSHRHKVQHSTVMRSQFRRRDRPAGHVILTIRHHGSSPNLAQAALSQRKLRIHATAFNPRRAMQSSIRKVRSVGQFQRNALYRRLHSCSHPLARLARPRLRSRRTQLHQLRRVRRLQLLPPINHHHGSSSCKQRLRARHTCRTRSNYERCHTNLFLPLHCCPIPSLPCEGV